ncbi:hypothetical protein [Curtobacterium sp. RRHDQ10]|uniref:hypothetical protein n=1 Tax=Curtobacterium phyllosphaerae TaxID=3413379 RepID=UPI003BF25D7D
MSRRRGLRTLGGTLTRRTLLWVAIGVVALVVVDVVLVAVAVGRTAPGDHGRPGPIPTFTSEPAPASSGTPSATASSAVTPSATPSSSASADAATDTTDAGRVIAASSGTVAWRSTGGTCDGPDAVVERSTDGGATWKAVDLSGYAVHRVLSITTGSARTTVLAATGAGCITQSISTYTNGQFWAVDKDLSNAAAGLTHDGRLQLAGGVVDAPCAGPRQVVQGSSATAVVCADALAWRHGSGSWVTVPLAGLRAVALNGASDTVARVGRPSCDGVSIESLATTAVTAASRTTVLGCAPVVASDGGVALAQSGASVWLWSGDEVLVSANGGAGW